MPLKIIHGNALVAISNKISEIRKEYDPISVTLFSGKEISFEKVIIETQTPQLFSDKRLIILESYDDKIDISKLTTDDTLNIIIKFEKPLTKTSKVLKDSQSLNAQVILLSEKDESTIFPFLDNIASKNPKCLDQLNELNDQFGSQYILTMIFFMLRRFAAPPANLPTFVLKKIETQQKNFTAEKINNFYLKTIETDFKIKKGLLEEKIGLTMLINEFLIK